MGARRYSARKEQRDAPSLTGLVRVGLLSLSIALQVLPPAGPAQAQSGASVLERHRERARGPRSVQAVLEGRVVATTSDALLTTISAGQWQGVLHTDDFVSVRIAGRALRARFFEAESWQRLLESPDARDGLDVDVVCTVDAHGSIVVIGLGGGLTDWLAARAGTRIVLELP